ncbi:MAG: hypothetical protein ABI680_01765 [Chthoniobacteraceae bacterium]
MRALLFAALILVGSLFCACSRQDAALELTPRAWRSWTLPSHGPTLPTPRSLAIGPNDELATLDTAGRVIIYDADGKLQRQWQMLDVSVGKPEGIVILRDGRVVVCDTHYHRIVWFDRDGRWLKNIGREGEAPGEFIFPVGICKDPQENLYICEYGGHDRVQKFTREGELLLEFGSFGTAPGQFQRPSGLTWREGKIYVTDAINNRVSIFSDSGPYLAELGSPERPLDFALPYDIDLAPDGVFTIIEYGAGRLSRVDAAGRLLGRLGHTGSGRGQFATPGGIAPSSDGVATWYVTILGVAISASILSMGLKVSGVAKP